MDFEGGFLLNNAVGDNVWLLILEWNRNNGFYVVLFPEDRKGPVAEIHTVIEEADGNILKWKYSPSKRDGLNDKRKEYFEKYFFDVDVSIDLPNSSKEVVDFFGELLSLYENRNKAHCLDDNVPDFRNCFPEGKRKERLHYSRERNSSLIKAVKKDVLAKYGKLICACCGFDFKEKYGELGSKFIEAHHTKPISELHEDGEETRKEDIALVCSNCHQMLHRRRPWLRVDELEKLTNPSI